MPDGKPPVLVGITYRQFIEQAAADGLEWEPYSFDLNVGVSTLHIHHWQVSRETPEGYRSLNVPIDDLDNLMTTEELEYFCRFFMLSVQVKVAGRWLQAESKTIN